MVILTRREPPGTVLPGAAPQQLTLQPLERADGLQLGALCPLPATCAAALGARRARRRQPGRIDVVARLRAPGHADKSIEERLRLSSRACGRRRPLRNSVCCVLLAALVSYFKATVEAFQFPYP